MQDLEKIKYRLTPELLKVDETLLTTSNGYIGIRGCLEEGCPKEYSSNRATYINGVYENKEVTYPGESYGLPASIDEMIDLVDLQNIRLFIGEEALTMFEGTIQSIERKLDIQKGYALRKVIWTSPMGHTIELQVKRMTSFEMPELMIIDYQIKSLNYKGEVTIDSDIMFKNGDGRPYYVSAAHSADDVLLVTGHTYLSNISFTVATSYNLPMVHKIRRTSIQSTYKSVLKVGETLTLVKYGVYTDSIRHGRTEQVAPIFIREALKQGIDAWYRAQKDYLYRFWKCSKVEIIGQLELEEAMNYGLYQLMASAGKDGYCNIGSKGLTGDKYEGNYFWDTEIYMLPFLRMTMPNVAKSLMMYRYKTLPEARNEAIALGHAKGAKFPWCTISGKECSTNYVSGSAQFHVNADVAYSYIQHYLLTGDMDFIMEIGLEVIIESGRFLLGIGHYDREGNFVINGVTGPDEFTAIVDNNFYTNAMAQYHLEWTVKLIDRAKDYNPERWEAIQSSIRWQKKEFLAMKQAAGQMYLPFDKQLGIDLQSDGFEDKENWNFEGTLKSDYPFGRHFHPLVMRRYKILKQADTVLAHALLDNRPEAVVKKSFDYYERCTTHDSSLSPSIFGLLAARIGYMDKALDYLKKSLAMDFMDVHGDTGGGLHLANAGGAFMLLAYGFGGLRIKEKGLHLYPKCPDAWRGYSFRLTYRGSHIKVLVEKDIRITCSQPITLWVYGQSYEVKKEMRIALDV